MSPFCLSRVIQVPVFPWNNVTLPTFDYFQREICFLNQALLQIGVILIHVFRKKVLWIVDNIIFLHGILSLIVTVQQHFCYHLSYSRNTLSSRWYACIWYLSHTVASAAGNLVSLLIICCYISILSFLLTLTALFEVLRILLD